jgi:ABC-type oligopeptide transport system substrate-binding subunit
MKKLAVAAALSCVMASPLAMADIKQGGSMIVTYKDDVSTLDPAIGYDWQNWSMIKSLFDGLQTEYNRVGAGSGRKLHHFRRWQNLVMF